VEEYRRRARERVDPAIRRAFVESLAGTVREEMKAEGE
jgi:hypothetical protein